MYHTKPNIILCIIATLYATYLHASDTGPSKQTINTSTHEISHLDIYHSRLALSDVNIMRRKNKTNHRVQPGAYCLDNHKKHRIFKIYPEGENIIQHAQPINTALWWMQKHDESIQALNSCLSWIKRLQDGKSMIPAWKLHLVHVCERYGTLSEHAHQKCCQIIENTQILATVIGKFNTLDPALQQDASQLIPRYDTPNNR